MIQQTVHDELLRYHKTLLIWTDKIKTLEEIDGPPKKLANIDEKNQPLESELNLVKKAIVDLLKEAKGGVSLA